MSEVATMPPPRRSVLSRIRGYMGIGSWDTRPGPLSSPAAATSEGWIPLSWPMNFGQVGFDPIPSGINSVVYSCISVYARTIAQLPGYHRRMNSDAGADTVTTSALSRILLKPNAYQTQSHFLGNMVAALLAEGNGYALCLRNDRQEISTLHQLPSEKVKAYYAPPSADNRFLGEVFYSVGGNPLLHWQEDPAFAVGSRWMVPQRDILHVCGPSDPDDPMKGTSPLIAGAVPIAVSSGGAMHFARFFQNASRPSGVLSTDATLTTQQVADLRRLWIEQTTGANIGGVPILTTGLKWSQMAINSTEMQVAESMKQSTADIARLFGVPLALIGEMGAATFNNTEQLIMMWLRQGLGYYINHIELAYDQVFGIERTVEYTELDVDFLLRPDFKTRIEGYARGVQGGIYAPNEARAKEGLKKVKGGDEPRVQQQQVPLDWGGFEFQPPPVAPPPKPALPTGDEPPADDGGEPSADGAGKDADALFRDWADEEARA